MSIKLTNEAICINEVIFNGILEQSVELDYLLPDYCQSIFKVLKCKIVPKITSQRMMNGNVIIDGVCHIKIIYVSEDNHQIRSIHQKQVFSKSIELKDTDEHSVLNAFIKCDYSNCRVVNQRRLDIRGAISINATVSCVKPLNILTKAEGLGVQTNSKEVTALDKKLNAVKEFTIREELEIGYGKSTISEIFDYNANGILTEYKIIANKVIIKGEIMLHLLYSGNNPDSTPEIMDYSIPISQIIDLQSVSEEYKCMVTFDITAIDINLKQNGDGEYNCFDTEFSIRICCEANKNAQIQLVNDIFSTDYEVNSIGSKVRIEELVDSIHESIICKTNVQIPQNELECVYDIFCEFLNETVKCENGFIDIDGALNVCILAKDCENMPTMIEKSTPCKLKIDVKASNENTIFTPFISVASTSYNLISDTEIEVRVEVKVCSNLFEYSYYNVIDSIEVDETVKKEKKKDVALLLYYAKSGEDVWDIAKKYNSCIDSILSENELSTKKLTENMMLLIPTL